MNEWLLSNKDIVFYSLTIVFYVFTIKYVKRGLMHWGVEKSIAMYKEFEQDIFSIKKEVDKIKERRKPNEEKLKILYTKLFNKLELIALLVNEKYINVVIAKEMFASTIKEYYEEEYFKNFIKQYRKTDKTSYMQLEKLYNKWNKQCIIIKILKKLCSYIEKL